MSILPWISLQETLIGLTVFLLVRYIFQQRKKHTRLPPGPWGWPIIGNLLLLMKPDKRVVFRELSEKYGPLVRLSVNGRNIVVVNGHEALHEVFVEQSRDFEQRPQVFTVLKVGQGKAVVNSSGKVWKEHRSFLLKNMKQLGIGKTMFQTNVVDEVEHFLQVLDSTQGEDFDPRYCVQTATSNVICSICFGKRFDYADPDFKEILNIFDENMKASGSTAIVNYFPFLEKLPGDPFKCVAALDNVEKIQRILRGWIIRHRQSLDPAQPRDIIDRYILELEEKRRTGTPTTMDESQLLKLVGDLFVGGTETTATTIRWAMIFLVRHPEVQAKVLAEIRHTLLGRGEQQLSILDKKKMPYTCAVILESQRLGDIAPFSLPHANFHDVILRDYVIPGGSVVIPNVHSVHYDPETWTEPNQFRPERFLDSEGRVINQKKIMPFFIGTRDCIGRNLGKMEVFLFLTSVVQHFELLPSSNEEMPPLSGHLGITYVPDPHCIRFARRDTLLPNVGDRTPTSPVFGLDSYFSPKVFENSTSFGVVDASGEKKKVNGAH